MEKVGMWRGGMWVAVIARVGVFPVKRQWALEEERTVCDQCVDTMGRHARKRGDNTGFPMGERHGDQEMGVCASCDTPFAETSDKMLEVLHGEETGDSCEWLGAEVRNKKEDERVVAKEISLLEKTHGIKAGGGKRRLKEPGPCTTLMPRWTEEEEQEPAAVKQEQMETESEPEGETRKPVAVSQEERETEAEAEGGEHGKEVTGLECAGLQTGRQHLWERDVC